MFMSDLPPYLPPPDSLSEVRFVDFDSFQMPPPEGIQLAQAIGTFVGQSSHRDTSPSPFVSGQNMTGVYSYDGTKVHIEFYNANGQRIFSGDLTVHLHSNGTKYEGRSQFIALGKTFFIDIERHDLGAQISLLDSNGNTIQAIKVRTQDWINRSVQKNSSGLRCMSRRNNSNGLYEICF